MLLQWVALRSSPLQHYLLRLCYLLLGLHLLGLLLVRTILLPAVPFVSTCSANDIITTGSIAAGAQGASTVAGGLFATLQSAGMGGYGVAAVAGVAQGVGGAVAAAGGAAAAVLAKKKEAKHRDEEDSEADS